MAGTRVRCVCGTVFDPSTKASCPACGTKYAAKRAVSSDHAARATTSGGPTAPVQETVRRDGATGFGAGEPSFFEQHKTLVLMGGGAVGFLLLAFVIRLMLGGTDVPKGSERMAAGDAPTTVAPTRDEGARPASSDRAPSSDPSPSSSVTPRPSENPAYVPPTAPSDLPSFQGEWRLLSSRMQPEPNIPGLRLTESVIGQAVTAAFIGPGATATMTIDEQGNYLMKVDVGGEGQYTSNLSAADNLLSVSAQGVLTLSPKGALNSDRARAMLKPVRMDMPQVNAKSGDTQLALSPTDGAVGTNLTLIRSADSFEPENSVVGKWSYVPVYVDSFMPYGVTLELLDQGDYRILFSRSEVGMLTAAGGNYELKRSIRMGPELKGRYEFEGPNRFTLSEPRGTATWVRDDGSRGRPAGDRRIRR